MYNLIMYNWWGIVLNECVTKTYINSEYVNLYMNQTLYIIIDVIFQKNVLQIDDVSLLSKIYKQRIWNIYYAAMQKIIVFCLRVFFHGMCHKINYISLCRFKINCEKKLEKIKFTTHLFSSFSMNMVLFIYLRTDRYNV